MSQSLEAKSADRRDGRLHFRNKEQEARVNGRTFFGGLVLYTIDSFFGHMYGFQTMVFHHGKGERKYKRMVLFYIFFVYHMFCPF